MLNLLECELTISGLTATISLSKYNQLNETNLATKNTIRIENIHSHTIYSALLEIKRIPTRGNLVEFITIDSAYRSGY